MKSYTLQWFSFNEGIYRDIRDVVTNNPKMALFNLACQMAVSANSIFDPGMLGNDTIIKSIQTGHTAYEHYWLEYPNGEVLSIMEQPRKDE